MMAANLDDDLPEVDLRTLLGEMAALKAEVRAQTQAARTAQSAPETSAEALGRELDRAATREAALRKQVDDDRRQAALALVDVADRLEATLATARLPAPRGFFVRADPRVAAFAEGLELTLRRVVRHLGTLGVRRVDVERRPFDPQVMEAVGTRAEVSRPEGVVLSEVTAGYTDATGVVRAAQVIVNRLAPPGRKGRTHERGGGRRRHRSGDHELLDRLHGRGHAAADRHRRQRAAALGGGCGPGRRAAGRRRRAESTPRVPRTDGDLDQTTHGRVRAPSPG
jgi:molecular chaperone GrpE (heat shock protein)